MRTRPSISRLAFTLQHHPSDVDEANALLILRSHFGEVKAREYKARDVDKITVFCANAHLLGLTMHIVQQLGVVAICLSVSRHEFVVSRLRNVDAFAYLCRYCDGEDVPRFNKPSPPPELKFCLCEGCAFGRLPCSKQGLDLKWEEECREEVDDQLLKKVADFGKEVADHARETIGECIGDVWHEQSNKTAYQLWVISQPYGDTRLYRHGHILVYQRGGHDYITTVYGDQCIGLDFTSVCCHHGVDPVLENDILGVFDTEEKANLFLTHLTEFRLRRLQRTEENLVRDKDGKKLELDDVVRYFNNGSLYRVTSLVPFKLRCFNENGRPADGVEHTDAGRSFIFVERPSTRKGDLIGTIGNTMAGMLKS